MVGPVRPVRLGIPLATVIVPDFYPVIVDDLWAASSGRTIANDNAVHLFSNIVIVIVVD